MVLLRDLPDSLLAQLGSYLAAPSRVLFTIAISPNAILPASSIDGLDSVAVSHPRHQTSTANAILSASSGGRTIDVLDFGDIEKSLAARLTDGIVRGVLEYMGAVNNLRILKLTGCVNVTGEGLEPLRGSTAIEQIDISLVGVHERPVVAPEPMIWEEKVVPILSSIVRADGNSLKHVQLPEIFRRGRRSMLDRFLLEYEQLLGSRGYSCSKCQHIIGVQDRGGPWISDGVQRITCCVCMTNICYDCSEVEGGTVQLCPKCQRYYCGECSRREGCGGPYCTRSVCNECGKLTKCPGTCGQFLCDRDLYVCVGCDKKRCIDCFHGVVCMGTGTNCGKGICGDCYDEERTDFRHLLSGCDECEEWYSAV